MRPDPGTADTMGNPLALCTPAGQGGVSEETMARVNRLVAAIKAERGAESALQQAVDTGERAELIALLRRFVAARERERLAWEEATRRLEAELAEVKAAAEAAQERASSQQRAHADLELLHEHQRSIWLLERRRFEVTVAGLERTLRAGATRSKARLAFVAGLLLVATLGFGVAGDGDPGAKASRWLQRFGAVRQLSLPQFLSKYGAVAIR